MNAHEGQAENIYSPSVHSFKLLQMTHEMAAATAALTRYQEETQFVLLNHDTILGFFPSESRTSSPSTS